MQQIVDDFPQHPHAFQSNPAMKIQRSIGVARH